MTFNNYSDKDEKRVVETAMKFKNKDDIRNKKRQVRQKLMMRNKIEKELGKNTNKSLKTLKEKKTEKRYDKKMNHLRKKYEIDRVKEMDKIPDEMKCFDKPLGFNKKKLEEIKTAESKVVKYGDEVAAMKLHTKMALPRQLKEGYMNLLMDISYTKLRWQLKKDEYTERERTVEQKEVTDKIRHEENDIEEEKTRQVYDAESRVYNEKK